MRADRVVGVLLGAAAGDALGAPYEFGPAGQLTAVGREMQGGGRFGWKPGEWTDDTQMSLHIAASLLARDGVDEADLWDRFRTDERVDPPSALERVAPHGSSGGHPVRAVRGA